MRWRISGRIWWFAFLAVTAALVAAACGGTEIVEREVTRVVEQEREVTRVVEEEVEVTRVVEREVEVPVTVEVEAAEQIPEIHLRCNSGWPAGEYMSVAMRYLGDVLETRSAGKITAENFYAGAIWKPGETPDALGAGLADCGTMLMLYYRGTYPISGDGTTLPFGFTETMAADSTHIPYVGDVIKEELAATNMVPLSGVAGVTTWFFADPLPKGIAPDDAQPFEGLRIRGFGILPDVIRLLGGAAVSFPSPEIPIALRQGQLDGFITSYGSWWNLGISEDAPHVYEVATNNPFVIAMNKDLWDSLAPNVQEFIIESGKIASKLGLENALEEINKVKEEADYATFYPPTPDEKAKWIDWVQPIWNDYAARSADHQKWVDTVLELNEQGYTPSWER